jgi:RNA polymerase sigma factor (sigma-70 family)
VVHEHSLGDEESSLGDQEPDDAPSPEEHAIRANEIARLREAVEAMPEPFREAIVLRELEDLSYAEIAQITGVPVGTVMSRLSRGRTILATILLPQQVSNGQSERNAR